MLFYNQLNKKIFDMSVGTQNEINRVSWLENTLTKIPTGLRILDAGAGEQQFKKFCSHLDYVSQDFAEYDGSGDNNGNYFEYLAQEIRRISDVASMYSKGNMNRLERLALKTLLKTLQKFSNQDNGSSELLSFGYHVMAIKN